MTCSADSSTSISRERHDEIEFPRPTGAGARLGRGSDFTLDTSRMIRVPNSMTLSCQRGSRRADGAIVLEHDLVGRKQLQETADLLDRESVLRRETRRWA